MTKEIIALSDLYKRTKKEFKGIRTEYIDLELEQVNATLQSIKEYFDALLKVIPKDISLYLGDRLQIRLEKTFYYDTSDSKNNTMSIVLIEDSCAFQSHSVLDKKYEGLRFGFGDEITTFIQTDTLEYLTANWKETRELIHRGIVEELRSMMERQLHIISNKIQSLETLGSWKI